MIKIINEEKKISSNEKKVVITSVYVCLYVCMYGGCDDLFNISMDIHYIAMNTSAETMWVDRMCHVIIMVIIIK